MGQKKKKQIKEVNPKMGYFGGPNKALTNPCILRPNWSHVLGKKKKRNGRERRRRRREEEEEGGGFKPRSSKPRYGCLDFDMELWFCMDFLSRYMFVGYGL